MTEAEKAPAIREINDWICKNLRQMEAELSKMENETKGNWENLNQLFIKMIAEQQICWFKKNIEKDKV